MPEIYQTVSPINIDDALNMVKTTNGSFLNLSLSYKKLKNQDVKNLCEMLIINATWISLNLSGCQIDDAGASELAKITSLTTLDLSDNCIGNAGASELAKITGLTTLDLSDNCINDLGAIELAKTSSLSTLDLSDNFIGDLGASALAKTSSLSTLDLSENLIGDAGAIALAKNSNLTVLRSSNNEFEQSYQNRLFQTIQKNRNNRYNAYVFALMVKQDFDISLINHINSFLVPNSVFQNLTAFTRLLFLNEHQTRSQQKLLESELPYKKARG